MDVKRQLTAQLASIVKTAVREDRADHVDVLPSDILNSVCNVVEAIFIHGLKESRGASSKSGRKSKPSMPSYPEPNFWPFLEKFTHRNIRAQIGNLNQIKTDIGRARVWIRICLNDRVLENYMSSILREQQIVRHFYNQRAFLRDSEQCDLMLNYSRALGKLTFKAPLNSSILNEWTPTPLKLAGILTERRPATSTGDSMLDMDDVMENDENSDVAVAVSALEYDGLDDPAFSDLSDVRSESQFSIQSRPVAAYGDKRLLFSPDGGSHSGSDHMHDSVGSFGAIGRTRRTGDLDDIYESAMADDEKQKLDAILGSLSTAKNDNDDKNPFADSGVAASPPISEAVTVVRRHIVNGVKKAGLVEAETNTDVSLSGNHDEDALKDGTTHRKESCRDSTPCVCVDATIASTDPKPILADEQSLMDQLEMSFSPGNSLAGRGWSSPNFEAGVDGPASPSTSSMRSTERVISSSVGNSGGFAALFSAVINTSAAPRRHSTIDGNVDSFGENQAEPTAEKNQDDEEMEKSEEMRDVECHPELESKNEDIATATDLKNENGEVKDEAPATVTETRLISKSRSSSLDNFVVVEESQESLDQVAEQKSFRLSLLTRLPDDVGLDTQGFKCYSCQRTIGLPLFGSSRVCSYDGHYYCAECHLNDEKVIPARVLLNWDFKPKPVSRASKAFLDHIADQPVIDLQKANPSLSDVSKCINETRTLRLQLSYVAMYLLTCKESIAEDLRKRVWPKEYLYTTIDQYSLTDLVEVFSGQMQKHLKSVIQYAVKHVLQQCRLCAQKGFICELCNDQKIIYAFQLDLTHRCAKCYAVYHTKCVKSQQKDMTCPKCVRRELYFQQTARSSLNFDNVLPLGV